MAWRIDLERAIDRGDPLAIKSLLKGRAEDPQHDAFFRATTRGSVEIIEIMVTEGWPVDLRDEMGRTALIVCAESGQTATIRSLLRLGADPNARDVHGATALFYAAQSRKRIELVALLLTYGADPRTKDASGRSALRMAHMRSFAFKVPFTSYSLSGSVYIPFPNDAVRQLRLAGAR